jgi:hypothetical protein
VARLGWLCPPTIVASVRILDWRGDQFGGVNVIQCAELDRYIVAADLVKVATAGLRTAGRIDGARSSCRIGSR